MPKINKIKIIKTISVLSSTSILLSSIFLINGCPPSTDNNKNQIKPSWILKSLTESDFNKATNFLKKNNGKLLSEINKEKTFEFSKDLVTNKLKVRLKSDYWSVSDIDNYKIVTINSKNFIVNISEKLPKKIITLLKTELPSLNGKKIFSTNLKFFLDPETNKITKVKVIGGDEKNKTDLSLNENENLYTVIGSAENSILVKTNVDLTGEALNYARLKLNLNADKTIKFNGSSTSLFTIDNFTFTIDSQKKVTKVKLKGHDETETDIITVYKIKNEDSISKLKYNDLQFTEKLMKDAIKELEEFNCKKIGSKYNLYIYTKNFEFTIKNNKITKNSKITHVKLKNSLNKKDFPEAKAKKYFIFFAGKKKYLVNINTTLSGEVLTLAKTELESLNGHPVKSLLIDKKNDETNNKVKVETINEFEFFTENFKFYVKDKKITHVEIAKTKIKNKEAKKLKTLPIKTQFKNNDYFFIKNYNENIILINTKKKLKNQSLNLAFYKLEEEINTVFVVKNKNFDIDKFTFTIDIEKKVTKVKLKGHDETETDIIGVFNVKNDNKLNKSGFNEELMKKANQELANLNGEIIYTIEKKNVFYTKNFLFMYDDTTKKFTKVKFGFSLDINKGYTEFKYKDDYAYCNIDISKSYNDIKNFFKQYFYVIKLNEPLKGELIEYIKYNLKRTVAPRIKTLFNDDNYQINSILKIINNNMWNLEFSFDSSYTKLKVRFKNNKTQPWKIIENYKIIVSLDKKKQKKYRLIKIDEPLQNDDNFYEIIYKELEEKNEIENIENENYFIFKTQNFLFTVENREITKVKLIGGTKDNEINFKNKFIFIYFKNSILFITKEDKFPTYEKWKIIIKFAKKELENSNKKGFTINDNKFTTKNFEFEVQKEGEKWKIIKITIIKKKYPYNNLMLKGQQKIEINENVKIVENKLTLNKTN